MYNVLYYTRLKVIIEYKQCVSHKYGNILIRPIYKFSTSWNVDNYQYHFRWQPTRAPNPWEGILQATSHGPVCPQRFPVDMRSEKGLADAVLRMPKQRLRQLQLFRSQLLRQSEDCLYMNIFVPLKIPHSGNARGRGKLLWSIFMHVASNKPVGNISYAILVSWLFQLW